MASHNTHAATTMGEGIAKTGGMTMVAMILPRPATSIQRATTKRRLTVSDPIEGVDNSKRLILTEEESEATQMIPTEFEGAGGTRHPVVIMSTKSEEAYRKMTEGGKVALVTCYNANTEEGADEYWLASVQILTMEAAAEQCAAATGSRAARYPQNRNTGGERRGPNGEPCTQVLHLGMQQATSIRY